MTYDIPDERLRLVFTCCHPALAPEARVALTLRTLGGLTTEEIARAFLVPSPTMAQRLDAVLVDSYYGLIEDSVWDGAAGAPYTQTATAPLDGEAGPYCGALPADGHTTATDTWQSWPSLVAGFRDTGDPLFLERAESMFGGELGEGFLAEADSNLGNRAGLLALVEGFLAGP